MAKKRTDPWAQMETAWNSPVWDNDPRVRALREEEEARLEQERMNYQRSPSTRGRYMPEQEAPTNQVAPARFAGALVDAVQGGVQSSLAGATNELSSSDNPFLRGLGDFGAVLANTASGNFLQAIEAGSTLGTGVAGKRSARSLMEAGMQNQQEVDRISKEMQLDWLDQGVLDLAQSPSSAASVFGGPAAIIGGADVYAQETLRAEMQGLNREQAELRGGLMGGTEFATSLIPTGKLFRGVPFIKNSLDNVVSGTVEKWVKRTANQMAGEALQETTTTLAQMGVDSALSKYSPDAATREYAANQLPKTTVEFWDQVRRSAVAGSLGGGALGQFEVGNSIASDAGKLASDMMLADIKQELDVRGPARTAIAPNNEGLTTADQWLRSPFQERGESVRTVNTPSTGALLADAQRIAGTMPARQADLPQDAQDFIQMTTGATRPKAQPAPSKPAAKELEMNQRMADAVASRQKAIDEARKAVADEESAQFKALKAANAEQKKAHTVQRNAARSRAVADAKLLPVPERATAVATAIQEWDANNPMPTPLTEVPAAKAKGRFVAKTVAEPTATQLKEQDERRQVYRTLYPDMDEAGIEAEMAKETTGGKTTDSLKKRVGMSMASEATTGVTPAETVAAIRKRIGTERGNVLAKLIGDGKLKLHDNDSTMPSPGAGSYDPTDGSVNINTATLDPDNIIGGVLEQAAGHEFDHAARVSQNKDISRSVGDLFTPAQTSKLVSSVRAMQNSSNPKDKAWANKVIELATKGSTEGTFDKEVAGYAVSESLKQRQATGAVGTVARQAVSAVRTWAKKTLPGIENDINVKDIAYLSDKVMNAAARTEQSLAGDGEAMSMIRGESDPQFAQAEKEGRVFRDPADGKMKFITSDKDATIVANSGTMNDLRIGKAVPVTSVLKHDDLFKSYPFLGDAKVVVDNSNSGMAATYLEGADNTIGISPEVRDALKGDNSNDARKLILHELQHGIQGIEGFARGGNPGQFRTDADKSTMRKYNKAVRDVNRLSTLMGGDLEQLDLVARTENQIKQSHAALANKSLTLPEFFEETASALETDPNQSRYARTVAGEMRKALADFIPAQAEWNEVSNRTTEQYERLRGEQEAYFVMDNADRALEDLPLTPLDSSQYEGEPIVNFTSGKNNGAMSMAAPTPQETNNRLVSTDVNTRTGRALQLAKAQLLYDSGIGKDLYDRLQLSVGEAALDAQRGLNAGANINVGIERLAKHEGKPVEEVRAMVEKRMDALAKLPSPEARERALASMVRQYPTMKALATAYSDIDQLTKQLVANMLRADPDPPQADIDFMNDLLDNSFGYTTRMYAAYQGEAGTEYSRKLMADYNKAVKRVTKDKPLSSAQAEAMKKVDAAVKHIADNDLSIPDAEHLSRQSIENVRYLYNTWIGDADRAYKIAMDAGRAAGMREGDLPGFARTKLEDELLQFAPKMDTGVLQQRAKEAVDTILGLGENIGSVPKYVRTISADRGIFQKREELPEPIRDLLGEISDPATRVAATIAKQGELAARNRFMLHMRDKGEGRWVVNPQTPAGGKFTATLSGEGFGPLDGWKTTPQLAVILKDQLGMFSSLGDALAAGFAGADAQSAAWLRTADDWIKRGAGAAKVASVILEGFGTAMNAIGSVAIFAANGAPMSSLGKGLTGSAQLVLNEMVGNKGELSDNVKRAIRLGVTDSAKINELRDLASRQVKDQITGKGPVTTVGRGLTRAKRIGIEAFAQSDVWPKIAALNDRVDMLTKFYKAEGVEKSTEEIELEAAKVVKDSNISSDRVPPILKSIEKRGITTFMPYFYSVPRSLVYSAGHGAADLVDAMNATTTEGRLIKGMSGIRRLAGTTAATWGLMFALQGLASALNGDDDDMVEEAKKVMSPEARYGNPVYLGKDDTGAPVFFRLSRLDPYGPVMDLARALMDPTTTPDEMAKLAGNHVKDLAFSNRYSKVIIDTLAATIGDTKFKDKNVRVERIMPEVTSYLKDAMRVAHIPEPIVQGLMALGDTQLPGIVDVADPYNKSVTDPKDPWYGAASTLVKGSGGRLDRADPSMRAYTLGNEIKERRSLARARSLEYMAANRPESSLKEARDADKDIYDSMKQLTDLYNGMVNGLGMSPRQANEVLKDAGLTATDIAMIMRGKVPSDLEMLKPGKLSGAFSRSSMEQRSKNTDKMLSAEERAAALKARKQYLQTLQDSGAATSN